MPSEMAHYAIDCWDAECLTSHGWIECVGCADRSAYDLQQHSKASGFDLTVERRLATPVEKVVNEIAPTKEYINRLNSKKVKQIIKILASMNQQQQDAFSQKMNDNGYVLGSESEILELFISIFLSTIFTFCNLALVI